MKDHNKHKYKGVFLGFIHQLLSVDIIRFFIAYFRYVYFVKLRKRLRTYDNKSDHISKNTITHNLRGMKDLAVVRSLSLIKPLSTIESLPKEAKVLTIGPRTEGEILSLVAYGFQLKNLRGLDLISYSPWIDLGDMHNMPYPDNSFDAIVMGWVIAYSENPDLAAKEAVRVVKPGGIIAVGVEYGGEEGKQQVKKLNYTPGAGRVTKHTDDILKHFKGNVDNIYFSHNIIPERETLKGSVIAIFSVKKD